MITKKELNLIKDYRAVLKDELFKDTKPMDRLIDKIEKTLGQKCIKCAHYERIFHGEDCAYAWQCSLAWENHFEIKGKKDD